jgi:Fe(II)/alpha-ketoglutarate-dependent arginine beta-hydroxylase
MQRIALGDADSKRTETLISEIRSRHSSVEEEEFIALLPSYAQELPRDLRRGLLEFRYRESAAVCLVSGFAVDDEAIGDTPAHWADAEKARETTAREEFYFALCASVLGDVFGWASQQGGRLLHEVVPVPSHEERQINSGSRSALLWHTEDAFHPYRADYVGLMCLRNPGGTETTYAAIEDVRISDDVRGVLAQPRFVLRPDESHRRENADAALFEDPAVADVANRGYARVERLLEHPEKSSILFGDDRSPYLRLDSDAVDWGLDDGEAMNALGIFAAAVDDVLTAHRLRPGELLFVDNFRAVHGRKSFPANYDGRDRWLKRLNISRDLRRSRDARISAESRIVH